MKILVLGSKGQLGKCLYDQLLHSAHEVLYTFRSQIDISNFAATKKKFIDYAPDIVINATAYTAVDMAEEDFRSANLINNLAVANIATICNQLDCWLIHVSTDYVFDGNSELPYTESDETNPQNVYGDTKLKGEIAIQSSGCRYIILRTAWVYSEYGNNFLKSILRMATEKNELRIVGDQFGCPTYAQDIAKAIVMILENLKSKELFSCLYHYSGNFCCSWADFSQTILDEAFELEIISSRPAILVISTKEFPTTAKRPMRSELSSNKIKSALSIDTSDYIHGIRSSLIAIKNKIY